MSFITSFTQNATVDANNTSEANLSPSATFVGIATNTLGFAGIQTSLKTDQNAIIYVEQSPGLSVGTGTVTLAGTVALSGSGTNFLTRRIGDEILVDGEASSRVIATIPSNTFLTTTSAFSITGSGKTYQMHNWDISDAFNYYYSINNYGITTQAINSYVRLRVTNTGNSSTTYFRLQNVLCPIVEAVPRCLDADGHLKVAVKSFEDEYGFTSENTPMGEIRVAQLTRLVGSNFDGSIVDPGFWTASTSGSATITQASGEIILTSGTNSVGTAKLNSARRARYVSGAANRYRSVIQLSDTGISNNTRKWGIGYNSNMPFITDGAYFQLSGTTFSVVTLKAGSPSTVSSGSFNGVLGAEYFPTTNATTYEIYWTNSRVYFIIGGDVLHSISANTSPWSSTMSNYIYMDNVNSGNTTSVSLTCRVASIHRFGQLLTQPLSKYQAGTTAGNICKYSPGNLHSLVISNIQNNSVITLYDNTAAGGTVLWTFTATAANTGIVTIDMKGIPFYNGLTLVISAANSNVLVIYE